MGNRGTSVSWGGHPTDMTEERLVDRALETATERLIDAQDLVRQSIDAGSLPEPVEVDIVVRRAEDVEILATEGAQPTTPGSPSR